eukprot:Sspe_Gene.81778::Locus_52912_Transcript_1_1_Confidence_1.000_Length_574::g.81778::m.81778
MPARKRSRSSDSSGSSSSSSSAPSATNLEDLAAEDMSPGVRAFLNKKKAEYLRMRKKHALALANERGVVNPKWKGLHSDLADLLARADIKKKREDGEEVKLPPTKVEERRLVVQQLNKMQEGAREATPTPSPEPQPSQTRILVEV